MKFTPLILVTLLLIIISCSQEPTGAPRSSRAITKVVKSLDDWIQEFRKHYHLFKHPIDALDWIKLHPKIKTTGIESNLFANELNVHPAVWGKWVNGENDLVTVSLSTNRQVDKYIFHIDFTPKEQVAKAIKEFPHSEQFKQQGVAIKEIAEHVHFRQPEWSDHGLHRVIGRYIDTSEFVTRRLRTGSKQMVIFREGLTPEEQVDKALKEFPHPEQFKQQGVAIEEIAKHVHFRQPEQSDQGFHRAIGEYMDKKKFVTQQIERKTVIFRKGFTPVDR